MPSVSVIIPTYNYGRFIERAVNSVLSQSYQDYEIIIIDDGSTDDTKNRVVVKYHDERIIYIRHDMNRGPSAARNTGIKSSKGEFIAFLDSDDEWEPDKLYHQINLFRNASSDIGCVYCGARNINMMTMAKTDFYPPILPSRHLVLQKQFYGERTPSFLRSFFSRRKDTIKNKISVTTHCFIYWIPNL